MQGRMNGRTTDARDNLDRLTTRAERTLRAKAWAAAGTLALAAGVGLDARAQVGDVGTWAPIGPGLQAGRTRALAARPDDPLVLVAGSVGGGLWRSTDAGASWSSTGDALPNLNITAVAFDPINTNIVYAATGEGFGETISPRDEDELSTAIGAGIYKSIDAGQSWSLLPRTRADEAGTFADRANFRFVNDLSLRAVDTDDDGAPDTVEVFAATRSGIWKSNDGGANWTIEVANTGLYDDSLAGPAPIATAQDKRLGFLEVEAVGGSSGYVLASAGSFDRSESFRFDSSDGFWEPIFIDPDDDLTANEFDEGRTLFAAAPSDPSIVFAVIARRDPLDPEFGKILGVYRSGDGGLTWINRLNPSVPFHEFLLSNIIVTDPSCPASPFDAVQDHRGWYAMALAVDPVDPNIVWLGGVDLFRSDDAGRNWGIASYSVASTSQPDFAPADQHAFVFSPAFDGDSNQLLYVASDGGVTTTINARAGVSLETCFSELDAADRPQTSWTLSNAGYSVTRFLDGSAGPSGRVVGAALDSDPLLSDVFGPTTPWQALPPDFTSDGLTRDVAQAVIDTSNEDTAYFVYAGVFPDLRRTVNAGASLVDASSGIPDVAGAFVAPLEADPSEPERLWTGGQRAFRSANGGETWFPVSPDFPQAGLISALAIAPSDPENPTQKVAYLGFENGFVAVSTNADAFEPTWTLSGADSLTIGAEISSIAVDPAEPSRVYISTAGRGKTQICRSEDFGTSWEGIDSITFDLTPGEPGGETDDVPVHSLTIRPTDPDQIYAGTEYGVYASDSRGEVWARASQGLPNVLVEALAFETPDRLLAFTRGRSAYAVDLDPAEFVGITPATAPPSFLPVDEAVTFDVVITTINDELNPSFPPFVQISSTAFDDDITDGVEELSINFLLEQDPNNDGSTDLYRATIASNRTTFDGSVIEGFFCGEDPKYQVFAAGLASGFTAFPAIDPLTAQVAEETLFLANSGEFDPDFVVAVGDGTASDGLWEAGAPEGNGRGDPAADFDGNGLAWLTDIDPNNANSDIDFGETTLDTPVLEQLTAGTIIEFAYWFNDTATSPATPEDFFRAELVILRDGIEAESVLLEETSDPLDAWRFVGFSSPENFAAIPDTDATNGVETAVLRFTAADIGNPNILEAGVDAIRVSQRRCEVCVADVNRDSVLLSDDFNAWLFAFLEGSPAADTNLDGSLDGSDFNAWLASFINGCPGLE
ncbi:MAG: GC-type dockerin domain-anchored protein [Planctomycetota bacterium]